MSWNHKDSEIYVNGDEKNSGGTVETQDGLVYISSENSTVGENMVFGLVNFGDFKGMEYTVSGETVSTKLTQDLSEENKASFLIPFTEGTHSDIDGREQNIKGGLFSNPDFFEYSNPNFAYGMTNKKVVQATISYPEEKIDIEGFTPDISGSQAIYIRNMGETPEGSKKLNITR